MSNFNLNSSSRTHIKCVVSAPFVVREREITASGNVVYHDVDASAVELPDREVLSTENVIKADMPLHSVSPVVLGNVDREDDMLNQILNSKTD